MRKVLIVLVMLMLFPVQAMAVSSDLQEQADQTASFLDSINLPIRHVSVTSAYEGMIDSPKAKPVAQAYPDHININPNYLKSFETEAYREMRLHKVVRFDCIRMMIHEQLHLIWGSDTWAHNYNLFVQGASLEEAVVDAVAIDLTPVYVKRYFGSKQLWRYRDALFLEQTGPNTTSYKDQVVDVRKKSALATGQPWHSKAAFMWRVQLLMMPFEQRIPFYSQVK